MSLRLKNIYFNKTQEKEAIFALLFRQQDKCDKAMSVAAMTGQYNSFRSCVLNCHCTVSL